MTLFNALSIALLALCSSSWAQTTTVSNITLRTQLGPYPVSIYSHEIQTDRPEILSPTPGELRRLLVTIYRPFLDNFTCPLQYQTEIPYVPPGVGAALLESFSTEIPSTLLNPVHLINCSLPIERSPSSGPIVLFSPGYGGNHWIYGASLTAAASAGYTVVTIDPTYEATAVQFPDGFIVTPSNITNNLDSSTAGQNILQAVRINDTISVLDAIERGDVPGLSHCSPFEVAMYGHSFGGSTAVNAAFLDPRILGSMNIDGPFYNPVANGSITSTKPVFLLASNPQVVSDNWTPFYDNRAKGWKTWARVDNTVHYGWTDLPLLVDALGIRGTVVPESLTGTIDSVRLQEIEFSFTTAFLDFVLTDGPNGKHNRLLDGQSGGFPDVDFVAHSDR